MDAPSSSHANNGLTMQLDLPVELVCSPSLQPALCEPQEGYVPIQSATEEHKVRAPQGPTSANDCEVSPLYRFLPYMASSLISVGSP